MVSVKPDGTVNWQKEFAMDTIDQMMLSTDGIIAAGAVYKDDDTIGLRSIIVRSIQKYDFEMNLIWESIYDNDDCFGFSDISESGGNIYVTGYGIDNNYGGFVFGITKDGVIFTDGISQNPDDMKDWPTFS